MAQMTRLRRRTIDDMTVRNPSLFNVIAPRRNVSIKGSAQLRIPGLGAIHRYLSRAAVSVHARTAPLNVF
jgi:hypothetical protein